MITMLVTLYLLVFLFLFLAYNKFDPVIIFIRARIFLLKVEYHLIPLLYFLRRVFIMGRMGLRYALLGILYGKLWLLKRGMKWLEK